jgi:hypothetical protein
MPSLQRLAAVHLICAVAMLAAASAPTAQSGDEPVGTLRASSVLPATIVKGPHHVVDQAVGVDGYYYTFTLTSDYGPFSAVGRSQLDTRLDEIRAIAALSDVSKSKVFLEAAGGAVVDIGKGAVSAAAHPVETAKGIGGGIKRFGVNLGRASKRVVTTEGGASSGDSTAETAANTVLGVSGAMRRWAQKVGADPYTTNVTLRDALKSIAEVDAAGTIATKIVVPIPAVVGTAATVGDLVWSKDPEELRKLNEQRATGLGVTAADAARFFRNGWYTLTLQTRIIAALDAVKIAGAGDYLVSAAAAESDPEARFFVESAEMLQRFHAKRPVTRLLSDSRAVVAQAGDQATVLAPIDNVRSTADARDTLDDNGARARQELKATRFELRLTGRATEKMKKDARDRGWTVTDGVR